MVKDQPEIKRLLDDPETRQEGLLALGEWVIKTCLLFGASLPTAYHVAAVFVGGVKRAYEENDALSRAALNINVAKKGK